MSEYTHVNLKMTKTEVEQLRLTAKRLGLIIGRGTRATDGSIRQLNQCIANGILEIKAKEETVANR
jgi:hypothetical protein